MSPYRRAEGTLRPLLDLVDSWEDTLTAAGFDVIDARASLDRQRNVGITITGAEDDLRRAIDTLGLRDYWISTTDHEGSITRRASFHDVPGVTYVTVDAMEVRGGEPR